MIDAKTLIDDIEKKLGGMSEEELMAYFRKMGFDVKEKEEREEDD